MINKEIFYTRYREQFGHLKQSQVDGINAILDYFDSDEDITLLSQLAYILSTVKHETAGTFQPIPEIGHGHGHSYGVPDPETGKAYYGRGFVQLTWKYNYQKFADILGIDLVNNPDLALQLEPATKILFYGMLHGSFTGKKLSDYLNDSKTDYNHARKIINGMDRSFIIAGYAEKFYKCLEEVPEANPNETADTPQNV